MPSYKDPSRVDSMGRAYKGSQKQIQTYVNERRNALSSAIAQALSPYDLDEKTIHWVSPLAADEYSKYRDSEFLGRVGFVHLTPQLLEFWPRGGPFWDGLARIKGGCILVEAKSHVKEIYGEGCGASPGSKQRIQEAFDATKAWLGVSPEVDWTGRLYQFANRYATLYFLREVAGVQAYLVNVYFVSDPLEPTTREEWDAAIEGVNRELGLVREVPYSGAAFLLAE